MPMLIFHIPRDYNAIDLLMTLAKEKRSGKYPNRTCVSHAQCAMIFIYYGPCVGAWDHKRHQ